MTALPGKAGPGRGWRGVIAAVSILGPAAALLAVWLPLLLHYHVGRPDIGAETVAALRSLPTDAVLERIDDIRFGLTPPEPGRRAAADELLAGRYHTPDGEVVPVALKPTDAGLNAGSPSAQLRVNSLVVADTLLAAYRETGSERYFQAALGSALAWARFERSARIPVGFLWNDNAIAARVLVLTRLWRDYRKRPDFDPGRGAELLAFVARSTAMLARDSHYTVRTNHGVMQDLALLHAAIAFPRLPGTEEHERVALDRLAQHLPFYISPGGVVLEHSSGYQDFAIRLLRIALEYSDVLGVPGPPGLRDAYAAAECLQRHVTRPDGSLPTYGDTLGGSRPAWLVADNAAVTCPGTPDSRIDEDFGLASLRGFAGPGSQLFMSWANFEGRAHKHDDELAAWLWLGGQDWWFASGYWPYGDGDRDAAVSWRGANAPHAVDEAPAHGGESRLLYSITGGELQALDVGRSAPDGRAYRRQIFGLGAAGVLTLDSASGGAGDGRFESVWTLAPEVAVQPLAAVAPAYELSDAGSGHALMVSFAGSGQQISRLSGSRHPFGGLTARGGTIRSAEALVATAPFGGWSGAFWGPLPGSGTAGALAVQAWTDPAHWSLSVPAPGGAQLLARDGETVTLNLPQASPRTWRFQAGAASRPLRDRATALYRVAAARYPPFRDYVEYRVRASAGIGALFVGQYLALWLLARLRMAAPLRVTVLALAWAGTGWWLYHSYLA